MEAALLPIEGSILLWIQENIRTAFLTPIELVITRLGDKGILWIVIALALMAFPKTRRTGTYCAVSMVIGLLVTNLVIKNWVARVRPYELVTGLQCLVGVQKDFSFPSGHTTNSLACAWVLFRMTPKKYGVPALIMAILIALSRLYVGVHYPTDVLGGAIIGLCSAMLTLAVMPRLDRKFRFLKKFYRYPAKAKKRSKARRA